jgi:dienelactone hydrolase
MKKIFTLILVSVCAYASAQPYATGKRTIMFTDNTRTRDIPTEIYYPAAAAGTNVPIVTGSVKFPVVIFGHGFLIGTSSYKWITDSLVKNGYIVAFPTTEDGLIPVHLNFGLDMNFLATRIASLNDSSASFLYQRVTKKVALGGHSMGGGSTFLAAALQNSVVKAVFNFAAAETTPSATSAALLDFKPTLIIGGSGDCVTPDSIQNAMYNGILLACKTYVNLTDVWHCQFANNNLLCVAAQAVAGCGLFPPVNTNTVLAKTSSLVVPWLDYYLKDNCFRGQQFLATYNNLTGVTTKRRSCFPLPSCGPLPVKLNSFTGKVDGNRNNLYWNTSLEENFSHFEVERSANGSQFSTIGNVTAKAANGGGASYTHVDPYPYSGLNFYRLKIVDRDGSFEYSNIVKLETSRKQFTVTQLFPNPVKDVLTVQVQSEKQQMVNYVIYDITGKQLLVSQASLSAGINTTQVPMSKLSGGTYILQYRNTEGASLGTFKIVKD